MSLVELLPQIQGLPQADKLHLIKVLAEALASGEEAPMPGATTEYPIWSPYGAQGAADVLMAAIRADRENTG